MYSTSTGYKTAVDAEGRQTRITIAYSDVQISSEDILSYFKLTDGFTSEDTVSFIGSFPTKKINYRLIGKQPGFIFQSANRTITATASLLVSGSYDNIPMGTFIVTDEQTNNVTDEISIEAMDSSILFDRDYALSVFWPMTAYSWAQSICAAVDVQLGSTSWLNSGIIMSEDPFIDGSFRDAIKKIAQSCGCFAKMGRDNKLYFVSLSNTGRVMNEVFDYQVGDVYGPINALILTLDPTNDNVGIVDQTSIDNYGKTEIVFDDNPILNIDREGLITALFNAIKGITYTSTSIEYPGDPSLDVGDIISFLDQNLVSTSLTILSITFEHTGTWSGSLSAIAPSRTDLETDYDGDLTKRVKKAEITIDKQSGEIMLLGENISIIAQSVDDLNGAKTELEAKIDGVTITVTQQVDKISDLQSSTDENTAAIDANADAIALQKTYYNFGPNGQTIGRDDSPAQIRMEYDSESKPQVVITDGFNDTTKIKSNGMSTKNITVEESLVVGNHKVQKVTGSTTETIFFPI